MSETEQRQITFWIEKGKIKEIDDFLEEKGIKSRSKFIIDCIELIFINPFLLDKKIVKNIQLDREPRKGYKQLNFWIKEDTLIYIDSFLNEKGYEIRTPFIVKCLKTIVQNPDLLKEGVIERLRSDQKLLLKMVEFFDEIPCEFEFSAEPHEEKRVGEIKLELEYSRKK